MMRLVVIISLAAIVLASCNSIGARSKTSKQSQEMMIDSLPGQCPYLTKDAKGNTVLSWVRMINDSTSSFCYAVSIDGKNFGRTVAIPNTGTIKPHGENLPKIIFKPSGEIIALWGAANPNPKNKYSGLVFYVQSFDDGNTWTNPKPLTTDTASFDQRYYDVALLPNGEAAIIWLDNRKTTKADGSGLYFASTEGKNGFQHEHLISQQCCQCCRTDLFVDSKGGIHALYRGIIKDSIRDMVHMVSTDGAKTFSQPKRISNDNWVINGCPHTGPSMIENKDGLHFAWYTGGSKRGCFYTQSVNNGSSFVKQDSISSLGSHPQMTALSNKNMVIVWDEFAESGDKASKMIALQKRDEAGNAQEKRFITSDTTVSTYPVVSGLDETSSFVAYSTKRDGKNYVAYQLVKF
ncbi:MAG: sialidase family protein [Chitinophagaceae bacterium]